VRFNSENFIRGWILRYSPRFEVGLNLILSEPTKDQEKQRRRRLQSPRSRQPMTDSGKAPEVTNHVDRYGSNTLKAPQQLDVC
jgi:hypothetical protein